MALKFVYITPHQKPEPQYAQAIDNSKKHIFTACGGNFRNRHTDGRNCLSHADPSDTQYGLEFRQALSLHCLRSVGFPLRIALRKDADLGAAGSYTVWWGN